MASIRERFVDLFELPREILLNHPLLLVLGDESIYLENHRGIGFYESSKVQIFVEPGQVILRGEGLVIQEIYPHTVRIRGEIQAIHFLFSRRDQGSE